MLPIARFSPIIASTSEPVDRSESRVRANRRRRCAGLTSRHSAAAPLARRP